MSKLSNLETSLDFALESFDSKSDTLITSWKSSSDLSNAKSEPTTYALGLIKSTWSQPLRPSRTEKGLLTSYENVSTLNGTRVLTIFGSTGTGGAELENAKGASKSDCSEKNLNLNKREPTS